MRANEKRKLIIKRITEAILAFSLLVLICIPITVYAADSTELKPARPTISTKVTSAMNGVKFTIAKTTGAEGYRIYMKAPGTTKYKSIKTLKKDGTDKRSYTKKNLANGEYWFKVRAYRVVADEQFPGHYFYYSVYCRGGAFRTEIVRGFVARCVEIQLFSCLQHRLRLRCGLGGAAFRHLIPFQLAFPHQGYRRPSGDGAAFRFHNVLHCHAACAVAVALQSVFGLRLGRHRNPCHCSHDASCDGNN